MRISVFVLSIAGFVALRAPHTMSAQSTCPGEANGSRAKVVQFLTSPNTHAYRQQYGMGSVDPTHLVLLTDTGNLAACERLRSTVHPGQSGRYPTTSSYYYADGFYFVSVVWVVPAGRIWTAFSPLIVFRGDFSYVNGFAT
jgi:hypothetical protein